MPTQLKSFKQQLCVKTKIARLLHIELDSF